MKWQDAKRIPLTDLLARLGYQPVGTSAGGRQVWYLSPFRQEKKGSFNVNVQKNIWNDLGLGKGGTVIDFVMLYFQLSSVAEVLRKLDTMGSWQRVEPTLPLFTAPASPPPANGMQDIAVGPIADRRLIHYLNERGIALETARPYVLEMRYRRGEREYTSLAFPHVTREGKAQGYELRNKYFQAAYPGKDISVVLPEGQKSAETVAVFEGFFDLLSWMTWRGKLTPPLPAVVLNSVALRRSAVETLREMGATQVQCFLDRDDAGRRLLAELREDLSGLNVQDQSGIYEGHKDFNDFLGAYHKTTGGLLV